MGSPEGHRAGKIAFLITRSDELGGAQIHVRDLTRRLAADGWDATILCGGNGAVFREAGSSETRVIVIPSLVREPSPRKDLGAILQVARHLRAEKPNLVSIHSSKAGAIGRCAAWVSGVPSLFTAHGWSFAEGKPPLARTGAMALEALLACLPGTILTVSEADRVLASSVPVLRRAAMETVHNAMFDVSPELLSSPEVHPPKIVMVARFAPQKDHATLLKALCDERVAGLPWTLTLVGAGPSLEQLRGTIEETPICGRVGFAGELAHSEVERTLRDAQVFVLTSNWEGLPRSIIEAKRAGLPVIASDVGGVREVVRDGVDGMLVPPRAPEVLAGRLRTVLGDPGLRREMGSRSRQDFLMRFEYEAFFGRMVRLYERVATRR